MINDKRVSISVTAVAAWLLWFMVAACMVAALVIHDHSVVHAFLIAAAGLAISTAAATLHIRSLLCTFSNHLRETFELGREVEREQQQRIRSVR